MSDTAVGFLILGIGMLVVFGVAFAIAARATGTGATPRAIAKATPSTTSMPMPRIRKPTAVSDMSSGVP